MSIKSPDQERRIDPDNRMNLDHASRAVDRFIPQESRTVEDISTASFREGKPMQMKVRALLDGFEGKLSPEQLRVREFVEAQYQSRLELLNKGDNPLYNHENPGENVVAPTIEEATQTLFALMEDLSPEELKQFLDSLQKPVITLEPLTSFDRYVAMLDGYKMMSGQEDTYVSNYLQNRWGEADKKAKLGNNIVGWNVALEEGATELEADPELSGKLLGEQIALWQSEQPQPVTLINQRRYAIGQMAGIHDGQPLDQKYWSVIDDGTGDNSRVPGGDWRYDRPYFYDYRPDYPYHNARFRRSLVGRCAKP